MNTSNFARLKELFRRAAAGQELTIGFLGGSITQGSLSTQPGNAYAFNPDYDLFLTLSDAAMPPLSGCTSGSWIPFRSRSFTTSTAASAAPAPTMALPVP